MAFKEEVNTLSFSHSFSLDMEAWQAAESLAQEHALFELRTCVMGEGLGKNFHSCSSGLTCSFWLISC
jgi:hypothetical protein